MSNWDVETDLVVAGAGACGLLAAFLLSLANSLDWTALQAQGFKRLGLMALVLLASGTMYLVTVRLLGLNLRQLLQR